MIVSLWNLTGISTALVPKCMSNFRASGKNKPLSRGFEASRDLAVRRLPLSKSRWHFHGPSIPDTWIFMSEVVHHWFRPPAPRQARHMNQRWLILNWYLIHPTNFRMSAKYGSCCSAPKAKAIPSCLSHRQQMQCTRASTYHCVFSKKLCLFILKWSNDMCQWWVGPQLTPFTDMV